MKRTSVLGAPRRGNRRRRAGFTLVELLVVITIIGVLASLITVGVFAALKFANGARIYTEITNMLGGVQTFKTQFSDYPPDGSGGVDKMRKFVRTAFPSAVNGSLPTGEVTEASTGPSVALVYWLSEVDKDPKRPFRQGASGYGGTSQKESKYSFFSFDESRIKLRRYYPANFIPDQDPPYVYFCHNTYQLARFSNTDGQMFYPYDRGRSTNQSGRSGGNSKEYAGADTCQIISAGLDKKLGVGGTLNIQGADASGSMSQDDEDNIVSFSGKKAGDIKE
jgi:prepilin-type N-terminal cleavage/methylation domain-containing protein